MGNLYKGKLFVLRIVVTLIVVIFLTLGFKGVLNQNVSASLTTLVLAFFFIIEYIILKKSTK
ncbi:hypothetical protein CWO92_13435 [Heyndrickxia camelliae]|uniref:Uncharacterized protein n=1 Tax=Heyndrickxia camelliae TaxID=1707093 RepID=A0A2N3LIG4_9BACI|nr:hypothetical protein CWO92_13435 [Heyndrickxia camelliae]